ncbi:substrate-binding periplasmic protein [Dongshaea marina]|uniref:substrate-binding periplasmic protein n=1 Tax=Dongshaea marina TaxID=2047966 RepID=UPI000D3EA4BA|nr:transporter substrate-binding domain-containing protein [Dongshaea marina]
MIQFTSLIIAGFAALTLNSFTAFATSLGDSEKPRVAPEPLTILTAEIPPLLGEKNAIMTDITRAAFKASGIQTKFVSQPVVRITRSLTKQKYCLATGSRNWFETTEQKNKIFINIYNTDLHFFYLKQRFPDGLIYHQLKELAGLKIGVLRSPLFLVHFQGSPLLPNIYYSNTMEQNLRKTYLGRVDLFIASALTGWMLIDAIYPQSSDQFEMDPKSLFYASGDLVFLRECQQHIQDFKQGLAQIKANGSYQQILRHYYGPHQIPPGVFAKD